MSYWDEFDKADKEESSGSGGIIGNVIVDTGFKVYASGQSNEDTFFSTGGVGGDARLAAKRKAETFAQEVNATKEPKWAVQIRVEKAGAVSGGNAATWSEDRFFVTDTWQPAFKDIVRPSLERFEIVMPFTGWARIGFKDNPYFVAMGESGKKEDPSGNLRFPNVAYITELFASKAEAMVAVGDSGGSVSLGFVPEGTEEWWADAVVDIKEQKEMHALNNQQLREYVKENYEIDLSMGDLIRVLK